MSFHQHRSPTPARDRFLLPAATSPPALRPKGARSAPPPSRPGASGYRQGDVRPAPQLHRSPVTPRKPPPAKAKLPASTRPLPAGTTCGGTAWRGEEYCGTSRGEKACSDPVNSEDEKMILYKKYLKLESSTHACKIKLLSFGEKQCVFISKVVVHLRRVSASSSASSPALGSRIDLQRVQTLMESMGSKLSPGAQQLMDMVRSQQQTDLNRAVSSLLPKKASDGCDLPNSELLPFLQSLCSRVSRLRVARSTNWQEDIAKAGGGVPGAAMEEQPVCSYLEKILTKNMELMERRLVDYIDQRLRGLQEHIDAQIASLAGVLQSPFSPAAGTALGHGDAGEGLSNGER
ncbi:uncharacterized protein C10orf88 homolog [Suricata suricatta]|uniref:uncharacterized protein C10orf88 homolog n=1 Tax=Suricata suricatta TaxID=37032 RepID=UPI00115547E6|nr:uncharacterized protein C10orf88 homolog [Suricata suricatta]